MLGGIIEKLKPDLGWIHTKRVSMPKVRMIECLLCGQLKPHKSRYLCLACYQHPSSKALKIPVNFRVEREDRAEAHRHPTKLPDKPTEHPPGSAEKVEVMRLRWINNEHIHHPKDAGFVPAKVTEVKSDMNPVDMDDDDPIGF